MQPVSVSVPRLGGVLDFMREVWAVSHGLQAASKRMARALGVTGPQRLVIRIVGELPGVSAGMLAEVLHMHPSTLTGVLKRLESRGLVRRSVVASDRRRVALTLTARGARLNRRRAGTVEAALESAVRALPVATVTRGLVLLAKMAEALAPRPHTKRAR